METPQLRIEQEGPLRYLLSLPKPQADVRHPVLCFLHGYDEGAPTELQEGVTRHGPLRAGNAVPALEDFIIVAPQMPIRGDVWIRYAGAVCAMVEALHQKYAGDPNRTYLTGFSFGGNGVFDLALNQPDTWAALWAVDPTRPPEQDPQCPVWLSFGQVARFRKENFIRALGLRPLDEDRDADNIYLDEGADHVGSATLAYRDERIYTWLLSKQLTTVFRAIE